MKLCVFIEMFAYLQTSLSAIRRESQFGVGHALSWYASRLHLRFLKPHLQEPKPTPADLERPISVVVPASEKDADVLPACLEHAKKHLRNPVEAFWVVAPPSEKIAAIAAAYDVEYVSEDQILPVPARELKTRGWIIQQLIKINVARSIPTAHYLVLDSDTIFLQPQCFFSKGRSILRYSDQYELLYNPGLKAAIGHGRRFPVSFVTHHMLMDTAIIEELIEFLEDRLMTPWWKAVTKIIDQGHLISFSEFDLYGNFVMERPDKRCRYLLDYWRGIDSDKTHLASFLAGDLIVPQRSNTISFHRHTQ
ncbi:MAG: DUF6492 family protein [Verrucomicrobiales bacterium]